MESRNKEKASLQQDRQETGGLWDLGQPCLGAWDPFRQARAPVQCPKPPIRLFPSQIILGLRIVPVSPLRCSHLPTSQISAHLHYPWLRTAGQEKLFLYPSWLFHCSNNQINIGQIHRRKNKFNYICMGYP